MRAYLDEEIEKAVESDSEITLKDTREYKVGGYVIEVSCAGEKYTINENRRVQFDAAETIIQSHPNLTPNEIVEMIKGHARKQ